MKSEKSNNRLTRLLGSSLMANNFNYVVKGFWCMVFIALVVGNSQQGLSQNMPYDMLNVHKGSTHDYSWIGSFQVYGDESGYSRESFNPNRVTWLKVGTYYLSFTPTNSYTVVVTEPPPPPPPPPALPMPRSSPLPPFPFSFMKR